MDDWENELNQIEKKEEKTKKKKKEKKKKTEEEKKEGDKNAKKEDEKEKNEKAKEDDKGKKGKKPEVQETLKLEKDYIELAKKNVENIKKGNPLSIFILAYLKNLVELLGPTLDSNQLNELIKITNGAFNKKLNEGMKKKVSTKATIKVGKIMDRKTGNQDYQDDIDDEEEEVEESVPTVNMDQYIK